MPVFSWLYQSGIARMMAAASPCLVCAQWPINHRLDRQHRRRRADAQYLAVGATAPDGIKSASLLSCCERDVSASEDQVIIQSNGHPGALGSALAQLKVRVDHVAGTPDAGDAGVTGIVSL